MATNCNEKPKGSKKGVLQNAYYNKKGYAESLPTQCTNAYS